MNIRAAMAAMDIDELDHMAKMALIMLANRADRYTGMATVSIPRLAKDLTVHYATAWKALNRLVETGYVTVDKSAGAASLWMLTPRVVQGVTPCATQTTPCAGQGDPSRLSRGKESLDTSKERAVASLAEIASDGAVENLPAFADHARRLRIIRGKETDGDC